MNRFNLPRRLVAELVGTAALLATIVGSGIMSESLSGGNEALALLGNTFPIGAILVVLILMFAPISGAHFNPAVSFAFYLRGELSGQHAFQYGAAQILGAVIGVAIAHLMFSQPVFDLATQQRSETALVFSELIATIGLVGTIFGTLYARPQWVPLTVGLYISAAVWFTSSTSFANPAVSIGRALTDSYTGIQLAHVPAFVLAQFVGAALAVFATDWFLRSRHKSDSH